MVKVKRPKAVICDIEGTTTSTKFWGECLVPYIKFKTQQCLKERWNVPTLMELIDGLRKNTTESTTSSGIPPIADENSGKDVIIHSVVNNVIEQMNKKRYSKALQHFQIYVWLYGYQTEELKGHIFDDVAKAFNNWFKFNNIKIFTYASGVYLSQKMLFACSVKGNLTRLITEFLDVETYGSKLESQSYKDIARLFQLKLEETLFLSDNPKELTAAEVAGCKVILVDRPFNQKLTDEDTKRFVVIKSFGEIQFT